MEVFGFGARGISTAGAQTSTTSDYHAVYYNPSRIIATHGSKVGLGTQLFLYDLEIERSLKDSAYPTVHPSSNVGIHFGGSTSIGGFLKDRVGVGFIFYTPMARGTRLEQKDPRSPQSYMYQTLPDKMIMSVGVAAELTSWLRLGVGFQALASVAGVGETSVFLEQSRVVKRSLGVDFAHNVAPTAGLSLDLPAETSFGVAYRGAVGVPYELPIAVDLVDFGTLDFTAKGTTLWDPHCIDFGLSHLIAGYDLQIALTVSYALWSQAPAPNSIIEVAFKDAAQTTDEDLLLSVSSEPVDLGTTDILIPRLGVEWMPSASWVVRSGYAYRPTPLPRATKAASYLDANTHILSLGSEYTSGSHEGNDPLPLSVSLALQWHRITPRTSNKEDPSNPTGSLRLSGNALMMALELHHDF